MSIKKAVKKKGTTHSTQKSASEKAAPTQTAPVKKAETQTVTAKKTTSQKTTSVAPKTDDNHFTNFTPYKIKKGEEYMNAEQVEHFRHILEGWKQQLMGKVDETVHHMQDEAANFPDPNDRASQESEFAMELRTRDRERKLIKKIDESIDDLGEDYGYCSHCGIEIGIRRLEARPTATQCIDCKTLNEIREKQYGK